MEDHVPSRNTKDYIANNCSIEYNYQAHMLTILKEWDVYVKNQLLFVVRCQLLVIYHQDMIRLMSQLMTWCKKCTLKSKIHVVCSMKIRVSASILLHETKSLGQY